MGRKFGRLFGGSSGLVGCTFLSLVGASGCMDPVGIGTGDGTGGSAGGVASAGGAGGSPSSGGSAGGSSSGGAAGSPAAGGSPAGGEPSMGSGGQTGQTGTTVIDSSSKLDLLFVVDNSRGMSTKLPRFKQAALTFLQHLVEPRCVGPAASTDVPIGTACPSGTRRERTPVTDIHVGVITTSLGGHGGQLCNEAGQDDKGHLIPSVRTGIASYADQGFANWDAAQTAVPPGLASPQAFTQQVSDMLDGVGSGGCGFEASLEAWYRFLVDPTPPEFVAPQGTAQGTDSEILAQRAAFLRPDSAVSIVLISDEDDCSITDDDQGWLVATNTLKGGTLRMPKANSACVNPNDRCCAPCTSTELPVGCTPPDQDSACAAGAYNVAVDDAINLRCFDQKRRFGFDLLYPTNRYVEALTLPAVMDRNGAVVPNPLFVDTPAGIRSPKLVTFTTLVGVPWQDIAQSTPGALTLQSAEELAQNGRWDVLIGDAGVPADPFMRASIGERSGVNPITQDPILPSSEVNPVGNAINGHESSFPRRDDVQFACTFALDNPVDCSSDTPDPSCVCVGDEATTYSALCQQSAETAPGETQYRTGANPGLRHLTVQSRIGSSAVVGTICADDAAATPSEAGYTPSFNALSQRLDQVLR